jgi:hypothetical protein
VLAGRRSACGTCVTRPARRTRGSWPGADEIVQGPGPRMLSAALGLGDGHGGFRAYRLRLRRDRVGTLSKLPAVTPVIGAGIPVVAGAPVLEEGVPAGQNQTRPPMYEMGGLARPGHARPGQLPGFAGAARRPPVPGTRARDRSPGSSHAPGSPRVVPVSNGESIFTASANTAQEPEVNYFGVLRLSTRYPQKAGSYPHLAVVIHRPIHSPVHKLLGVTQGIPAPAVAARDRLILS